jgi:hypothetical protein
MAFRNIYCTAPDKTFERRCIKQFIGFPIFWTTEGGSTKRAYYGAYQGRHQLWTQDGESVAEGTSVTREDFDPNSTPQTYTVGETFDGVLSKRTYVDASLDDIKGIAVELWVDNSYNLTYNAGDQTWYDCSQMDWGTNYVVRKESGQSATCKLELQTAVNPGNATDIVPDGTVFSDPWNDANSTYELITDAADDDYLMLVYKTIGDNDRDQNGDPKDGLVVGDVVSNIWGIEATINSETVAFNWEYNAEGGWGSVSYLKNADESYKLLDDPIRFDSITAQNGAGDTKTIALQYDGWMMGLPEMYQELEKNDWTMNDEIADKILNLPAGTQLTDAATGTDYLLKPLEISQFLSVTADTTGLPDVSAGQDVDLSTVPDFVEHGMGDMPTDVDLLYSEGNPVE